ncbi:GNAT family N-acetyltransferase [Streptomyces sp. CJ_13]|uniref:GNAT family N-acetyltransferase n=1 Tax=Streptomyces sp. CJ_13 TaxID=2724943 RepID=UPI001BDC4AA2|nr:GNAT family N-acetyltransferase [Streptomyces sp. CJ_13]MBT1185723.1 GNAT family N-acetyltransferase [Streptomyces sp. CJ_13]
MKIRSLAVPPSDAEVDAWRAVLAAARAADLPGRTGPARVEVAGRLQVAPARGRAALWADGDGRGVAGLLLFTDGANDHTAFLDVLAVRPDARRRGVGTALWARVREELLAQGRTSVSAVLDVGGPGEAFARSLGFEDVLPMAWYAQALPEPPERPEVPGGPETAPGYALHCWPGLSPDGHAASLAAAHGAMEDAPSGDMDEKVVSWTADRLHAAQRLVLDRGGRFLTVAALTPAGEVAAYTELVLADPEGTRAVQYDTVVVPAHRGRGLGRAVKLRMLAEARLRHPGLRYVDTTVADENTPMRALNEALGYRRERGAAVFQLRL